MDGAGRKGRDLWRAELRDAFARHEWRGLLEAASGKGDDLRWERVGVEGSLLRRRRRGLETPKDESRFDRPGGGRVCPGHPAKGVRA